MKEEERERKRNEGKERGKERFRLSINSVIMNFSCFESFMYIKLIQNYQTLLHTKNRFIFLVSSVTITPG